MKTYCLVIDDDNQKEYFEKDIKEVLLKDHIELVPVFIETKDRAYMKTDHSGFDKSLIEKDCIKAIKDNNCSLVVSDYQIATKNDGFNGLDILNTITDQYPHLYKILYSGADIEDAIKKIQKSLSEKIPSDKKKLNDEQIISAIDQLKKMSCINDLVKGKGYAEKVIRYMRSSPLTLQQTLLSQLKEEYPEMTFRSCYTPFKGWKLKNIGEEVEKRTALGGDFQQSLISQVVAYLIDTNTDDDE